MKTNNGCKSQNDNEMQRTGFDINAKDLTERGKFAYLPSKETKVEIEITDNAINIQAGNVSVKIPRSNTQDDNPILQLPTLKQEPYEEVARKLYTCLLYTSPSPRDRQKSRMPSSA